MKTKQTKKKKKKNWQLKRWGPQENKRQWSMIARKHSPAVRTSVGSAMLRMSHHSTWPSVEQEKHSVPVLDCRKRVLNTGSRWLFSIVDNSTGRMPRRKSHTAATRQRDCSTERGQ